MKWIIALLIFSVLVLFHEFGHFLVAKLNGVEVEEFSLGFGPRLLSVVAGGTRYSVKLLWFGGSCQMKGMLEEFNEEEDGSPKVPEEGSFQSVSVGKRAAIVFAGPFFNFLLAFLCAVAVIGTMGVDQPVILRVDAGSPAAEAGLGTGDTVTRFMGEKVIIGRDYDSWYTFHDLKEGQEITLTVLRDGEEKELSFVPDVRYMLGMTYNVDADEAVINEVGEGSPLEEAGVRPGDVVTAIDGTEITTSREMYDYFSSHRLSGEPVALTLRRDGGAVEVSVVPVKSSTVYPGFTCNYYYREKVSAPSVIRYSFTEVRYWILTVIRSLGSMFTGRFSVNDLSGPVGVVDIVGQTYEAARPEGALITLMNMLNLVILLSANLGVMNLLPIPAVDGGRLLFLAIEAVRGKPMNRKLEMGAQMAAIILLLLLMVYVMFHDVTQLLKH